MTQDQDPQRLLARVKHIDTEHQLVDLELRNGNIISHPTDEDDDFRVGQVVLIGPKLADVEQVPDELWPEEPWIAVVARMMPTEVIVNTSGRLRVVSRPVGLDLKKGFTVEGFDSRGITRVLAEDPVPYIEISTGDLISVEPFKHSPDGTRSFDDFGGNDEIKSRAVELIEVPLKYHEQLKKIGAKPIKGVLLTGPSGTGKTMLARIIADQAKAVFYEISGPQVLSKWYGQSEELIRAIFEDAAGQDRAIVFFDEIDSLATQRTDSSHEASRRIVGQLLTLMDGFTPETNVMIVATTNRPQDMDSALLRPGRFDWEIKFPLPSMRDREKILNTSSANLNIAPDLPHALIAEKTEGWSPAQLTAIWSEAALLAVQDDRDQILEEDYLGGFGRVEAQRSLAEARQARQQGETA